MYYHKHLISSNATVRQALSMFDTLAADAILFVVDDAQRLVGSLTDGDVRRGLLKGFSIDAFVTDFIQPNPKHIRKTYYSIQDIIAFRKGNFKIIPVLNEQDVVINIINFRLLKSYLPIDALVMAGGRGERLRPLTDEVPKPMLLVGNKPIIDHNIDRMISYGIDNFWISISYKGDQIKDYFKDGATKLVQINYVAEREPMGTIGALSLINNFKHDTLLITNSDLLTDLDYEDFYLSFLQSNADLSVVTIPYDVKIPYAVLETDNEHVVSFSEKPTYTYYSNAGIYLIKKELAALVPQNTFFNATDLMQLLIKEGKKVHSYSFRGYWLDIGKPEDYKKAQSDIKHIKFW